MILRPYQEETHTALRTFYDRGKNRLLAHLATGLGKTSGVAAFLPQTFPDLADRGLLFLSHRREILYQAHRTFQAKFGHDKWIGLEMGEYHATGHEDFIFCSVDSIGRMIGNRINKFRHRYPGVIVVDEGHHVTESGTWDNILNYFGVGSDKSEHHTFEDGSKPLSVFLTATPVRADGRPLAPFLDDVACSFDIRYGIREGWLTDIKAYHAELENGEYSELDSEQQIDFLIKTWQTWGAGMRTLAFARNVAQSEMLAGTLNKEGICHAGHVDATTADEIRQEVVRRFGLPYDDDEAIALMTNRLIFTEGYDNPLIQCVLDNAPTESQSLYIQKIGRGLRADPRIDLGSYKTAEGRKEAIRKSSKPFLTYITAFPIKHGLDMPATLFGLPKDLNTHDRLLSEVVDIIQYEEETMPEAPTRDLSEMADLDIALKRQDVWTQVIYNKELHALTPLRWTVGDNFAAVRLPNNPFAKTAPQRTPLIIAWTKVGNLWQLHRVTEGGWNKQLSRAVRAHHEPFEHFAFDLNAAIKQTDNWLKKNQPRTYAELQRGNSGRPPKSMIDYLKRKKVPANYDKLTMETAMILKDDIRIRPKLKSFGLPTD